MYDVDMPVTIFDQFGPGKSTDTSQLANQPSSLPRHEGEGQSDNEQRCGVLDPVADQNANGACRVVITTRMSEAVHRLVVVTHMAHGHHWAI